MDSKEHKNYPQIISWLSKRGLMLPIINSGAGSYSGEKLESGSTGCLVKILAQLAPA